MNSKATQLREALEQINEDLLTRSDDIWLNIDHNDPEAMDAGVALKKQYNEKLAAFGQLSSDIEALLNQWSGKIENNPMPAPTETKIASKQERDRLIRELDRHTPHGIKEDFRFKRPCGMILEGHPYPQLNTWKSIYRAVAQHLARKDKTLFLELPKKSLATTKRGNPMIAAKRDGMRVSETFTEGLHFEVNLSANMIRDAIQRLLDTFNIPVSDVTFYLREDRDAEQLTE